jgi:trehalose-phosphatase
MTAAMKALRDDIDPAEFFRRVRNADKRLLLLLLDYDGTLAPFHVDPARARPYPGVCERLDAIMQDRCTRLVLITGRWTRDLLPLLTLKQRPEIWGSHGWEQLKPNGDYAVAPIGEAALAKLLDADALEARIKSLGGRCERKPGGFAVHWRGLAPNQIANIQSEVFENWMDQGLHRDLVWHDFDGGVELRAPGRNKGYVVDTLLAESPGAAAAYLGDDLTDEDAFRAIQDKGLGVLVRPEFRPTEAGLWLRPPAELLDFLDRWRDAARAN